jgi:cell division protein FtsZ
VVTKPFDFEGKRKAQIADEGAERLRREVDTLITIPNQHLLRIAEKRTPIREAFFMADEVLRQGVQGISDLITEPGEINIDFADVRTIMKGQGDALMGIGIGTGDNRATDAATNAINNPLLEDARVEGAKGLLVNVTGGYDLCLSEYEEVLKIITANADDDALIISGTSIVESMEDKIRVTVIATGFAREAKQPVLQLVEPPTVRPNDPPEIIPYEEWASMGRTGGRTHAEDFLLGRNSREADLSVPTILRERRTAGKE